MTSSEGWRDHSRGHVITPTTPEAARFLLKATVHFRHLTEMSTGNKWSVFPLKLRTYGTHLKCRTLSECALIGQL